MEALGINIVNMVIYSLLFIVLYIVIDKVFLKSFFKTLDERRKIINQGLESAEINQAKTAELLTLEKDELAKAKKVAKKEVDEIISNANTQKAQILEEAKKEAEMTMKRAIENATEEKAKKLAEVDNLVSEKVKAKIAELSEDYKLEIDKSKIEKLLKNI